MRGYCVLSRLLSVAIRSHNRPGTAALLPRFRQTRMTSCVSDWLGRTAGGGTDVFAELTSCGEGVADGRRSFVGRAFAGSERQIRSAHCYAGPRSLRYLRPSGQVASDLPSIASRMFRTMTRLFIAVLIGIGATLAWQSSYGDATREMVVARAPTLAWLVSDSAMKSPTVGAISPDQVQQLAPLASNLDVVRRSVEELAARQEQMAQIIATLQAGEHDIRQKMSSPPLSQSQQAASVPQQRPPQPKAQAPTMQSLSVPRPSPPAGPILPSR